MKIPISKLLTCGLLFLSVNATSQTKSFKIANNIYYLHQISYHDLSQTDPQDAIWNQTMISDRDYIYIADHTDNPYEIKDGEEYELRIKRYNTIDGTESDPMIIPWADLYRYEFDLKSYSQRCFYLVDCNAPEHLVITLNTPDEGVPQSKFGYYFYLLNKSGHIEKEFKANSYPGQKDVYEFGIPAISGNIVDGDFHIFLPVVDEIGQMFVIKYIFKNNVQSSSHIVYSHTKGIAGMTTTYTKPTVRIIDDDLLLIDDYGIYPTIISITDNAVLSTIENIHIKAHGCDTFDYDGHRFLYIGDIVYPENDALNGMTQFNIGLWSNSSKISPAAIDNSENSDEYNYTPLAAMSFGKSTIKSSIPLSYAYRQFMAISDYGNNVSHLHFYVPGEFLATYQLNKYDMPTGIVNISDNQSSGLSISVSDRTIILNKPVGNIFVYDIYGHEVFHSTNATNSINLANFAKSTYILVTPEKSFKIFI